MASSQQARLGDFSPYLLHKVSIWIGSQIEKIARIASLFVACHQTITKSYGLPAEAQDNHPTPGLKAYPSYAKPCLLAQSNSLWRGGSGKRLKSEISRLRQPLNPLSSCPGDQVSDSSIKFSYVFIFSISQILLARRKQRFHHNISETFTTHLAETNQQHMTLSWT